MTTIHLVACAAQKHVESTGDRWFILSAQHGVVQPEASIHSYDRSLNDLSRVHRVEWAVKVFNALTLHGYRAERYVFWAGRLYREPLLTMLEAAGSRCEVPMEGLGIGRQLQFLTNLRTEVTP